MQLQLINDPRTALVSEYGRQTVLAIHKSIDGGAIRDIELIQGETLQGLRIETSEQKKRVLVGLEIGKIARLFGSKGTIPSDVISGCVDHVVENYANLSLSELFHAFQQAAAGKIETDGGKPIDVALYGAPFNLEWMSRVLRGWKIHRRAAHATILGLLEPPVAVDHLAKNLEAHRAAFRSIASAYALYLVGIDFKTWEFWYTLLKAIGVLSLTKEQIASQMKAASVTVTAELDAEYMAAKGMIERLDLKTAIKEIENGDESQRSRVKLQAIKQIIADWFGELSAENITPESLVCDLDELFNENQRGCTKN